MVERKAKTAWLHLSSAERSRSLKRCPSPPPHLRPQALPLRTMHPRLGPVMTYLYANTWWWVASADEE